jgi:ATP-dependent Lon protease
VDGTGGDIMFIEARAMSGKGRLTLTGPSAT